MFYNFILNLTRVLVSDIQKGFLIGSKFAALVSEKSFDDELFYTFFYIQK